MSDFLRRKFIFMEDFLRTSRLPRWLAVSKYLVSRVSRSPHKKLGAATSYLMHQPEGIFSKAAIRQACDSAARVTRHSPANSEVSIARSVVIKACKSQAEPGIILISFETELHKVLSLRRFGDLQCKYRICFMPSWQNFFSPEVIQADIRATNPYYLLPSAFAECRLRPLLGNHCRILPFHAASWVNHKLYCLAPVRKDIDILMLANFARFKRHWKLFHAIRSLPDNTRIVLVGVPLGKRDRNCLLEEAKLFDVDDRIEIIEDPSQDLLRNCLEKARLMCSLSHREGSYVGVAESLMANTPVAMFANAMIGTKAYINGNTGFLLNHRIPLAGQLESALSLLEAKRPRDWAINNISAEANCRRFNQCLKNDYLFAGNEWTEDISSFYCIRFEFYHGIGGQAVGNELTDDYARIEREFGLKILRPLQRD